MYKTVKKKVPFWSKTGPEQRDRGFISEVRKLISIREIGYGDKKTRSERARHR